MAFPGGPSSCPAHYRLVFGRLRRLRPLSCTLALSRPVAGWSSVRVPQFRLPGCSRPVAACCPPGVSWENPHGKESREAQHQHRFGQVSQPFSLVSTHDASSTGSSRQPGSQGSSMVLHSARGVGSLSGGFTRLRSAAAQRMPLSPRIVLLMWPSWQPLQSLKSAPPSVEYSPRFPTPPNRGKVRLRYPDVTA